MPDTSGTIPTPDWRELAKTLGLAIVDLTPASREQSLALTDLENCIMHANAAIARHS